MTPMTTRAQASFSLIIAFMLGSCVFLLAGCGKSAPVSANYFALARGNSWLYEGSGEGRKLSLEIKVVEPDPAYKLRPGLLDVAVTGSLGDYTVSESGVFLEVLPGEVKLWGAREMGSSPRFYSSPYIWLRQPLEVGGEYSTAIKGAPTPALMVVTGRQVTPTPWGDREGFVLEEKGGAGPTARVRLVFVPDLGFTSIAAPDWPVLNLKDASLR